MKIINRTGNELYAGRYWAVGCCVNSIGRSVAIVTFTGEAPCLQHTYNCDSAADTLEVLERIEPPASVLAALESTVATP